MTFEYPDKSVQADWWQIPLLSWDSYSETANATWEIYDATGVVAAKVTHHRTTALQTLGFYDLAPHQTNSLTNHLIEKHFSAYGSEATMETCKVAAGFRREERYIIPRTEISLQHNIEWYEQRLLPNLHKWRDEHKSRLGDKSSCCKKFLYLLLLC